jgi:predicted transcriptional regulator
MKCNHKPIIRATFGKEEFEDVYCSECDELIGIVNYCKPQKKPKISFILSSSVSPRKLICKECNKKFKTNKEASEHSQKKQHHEYKLEGTKVELMIG